MIICTKKNQAIKLLKVSFNNDLKKIISLLTVILLFNTISYSQKIRIDSVQSSKHLEFKFQALIIPVSLITYGIIGIESDDLKYLNKEIQEEVLENAGEKVSLDDFTQYAPFVSVYALNAIGIEGKHNFKDRTIILAAAALLMGTTVHTLKSITKIQRPDGSSNNSFPSGHTATAFMGAEFLYQEYKDISIWYGISGYIVATGTGFFRMYNDRHWLTDIAAGAGIGILSTKIAYWIHPWLQEKIFKKKPDLNGIIMPFYTGNEYGLGFNISF